MHSESVRAIRLYEVFYIFINALIKITKYFNSYWLGPKYCSCHWLYSIYSYDFIKHSPNFNFLIPLLVDLYLIFSVNTSLHFLVILYHFCT